MCSNNTSGFINKENVQPLSTICKLDASDLNVIQAAPRELKPVVTHHCDFLFIVMMKTLILMVLEQQLYLKCEKQLLL